MASPHANIAAETPSASSRRMILLVAVLAFAGLLRLGAALDDYVIDEVWSYFIARQASGPLEIFRSTCSNSHVLNTLFVHYLSDGQLPWYRVPAVAAGIGTVGLLALAGARRGAAGGWIAAWLGCVSYPLLAYSAEARGYAPAAFFGLLAFVAAREYLASRRAAWLPVLWVAITLGILSQLSFVMVLMSLAAWLVFHEARASSPRKALVQLLWMGAVPLVFAVLYHVLFGRHVVLFAGEEVTLVQGLLSSIALALGGPERGPAAVAAAVLYGLILAAGMRSLRRKQTDEWFFHLWILFFAPAVAILLARTPNLFVRFFLVCIPFLYLLLAEWLADLWGGSRSTRLLAVGAIALFTLGSGSYDATLFRLGRGHYREAVLYMAGQTRGNAIVVTSDHDFRNKLMLTFYARALPAGKTLHYVPRSGVVPGKGPPWLILHRTETDYVAPQRLEAKGGTYRLEREYDYAGISGFRWFIYRRAEAAP